MNLGKSDYLLAVACNRFAYILKALGDIETRLLQSQLAQISTDRPIYVTGLARSGTTILLTILAGLPGLASHKYRDFPFVFLPFAWNRFLDRFAADQQTAERPHRDGIQISADSPEAFEEPIWQYFFPSLHDSSSIHVLDESVSAGDFEQFYRDHIRKILLLRNGSRYLSKGNYNITRILYLAKLFPDAKFIIPVRHPLEHVDSLVRQHKLFSGYAETDARIGKYLQAAGHYEFGPQRVPISLSADLTRRIKEAWSTGQEYLGYAIQWQAIYGHAKMLCNNNSFQKRIMILRFEDLCSQPVSTLRDIFSFLGMDVDSAQTDELAGMIKRPTGSPGHEPAEHMMAVWKETEAVAREYGYHRS